MEKPTKQNICNIGEYYLASILSARDCVVSITLGRAENFDLFALNPKGSHVKVQVKTSFKSSDFPYNKKSEMIENIKEDLFYVFIRYDEEDKFDYWVLSSKELYDYSVYVHKEYLASGKKDHSFRKIYFSENLKKSKGKLKDYQPADWSEKVKKSYKNLDRIINFKKS